MKWIIEKVLKAVGAKKLLAMTWDAVHSYLEEKAAATDTEFDDQALAVLDQIIDGLIKEA